MTGDLIAGNDATAYGGGIFSDNAGEVTATSTRILRNTAETDGGGIYATEKYGTTFTFTTSEVHGNRPDNCGPPASVPGCQN